MNNKYCLINFHLNNDSKTINVEQTCSNAK